MTVFDKIKATGYRPNQINFPDVTEVNRINEHSDATGIIGEVNGIPVIFLTYDEFMEFVTGDI